MGCHFLLQLRNEKGWNNLENWRNFWKVKSKLVEQKNNKYKERGVKIFTEKLLEISMIFQSKELKRCSNSFVSVVPPPLPLSKSALFIYRWIPENCSLKHEANFSGVCVCVCACVHVHAQSLSCVWLFAILWTVAHKAPLFMGFSRQEYWSGLPFPSPSLSVETSILSLIFKTIFFSQRGCTIPGSTVIPGRCMEWTEQAPIPTLSPQNPFNFSGECSFKNNGCKSL